MLGVITGREVLSNISLIYREFGFVCVARCLWALATKKRCTFLQLACGRELS
jgi:hypothetical protein